MHSELEHYRMLIRTYFPEELKTSSLIKEKRKTSGRNKVICSLGLNI